MNTIAVISLACIGDESGQSYNGQFKVKTLLSRRDRFLADEKRRQILGFDGEHATQERQAEAILMGQLYARIVEAPKWWKESDTGLEIADGNVIVELATLAFQEEQKYREQVQKEAQEALKSIAKQE